VYIFELSLGVTEPPLLSLVLLVSPVPGSSARPPEAPGSSVPHLRQQQHPTPPYSAHQVTWIRSLLGKLSYKLKAILICSDNQGSIFMASNPVMEPHSKHINIHYHRIRESVTKGNVELFFIDGGENPADLLTKNLPHEKFVKFRAQLGLQFPLAASSTLFAEVLYVQHSKGEC